jgi:hypothetical protein
MKKKRKATKMIAQRMKRKMSKVLKLFPYLTFVILYIDIAVQFLLNIYRVAILFN